MIEYGKHTLNNWEGYLKEYTGKTKPFENKRNLELGPGADISIGSMLIDKGAKSYYAFDINNLMTNNTDGFLKALTQELKTDYARKQLELFWDNRSSC